jgi:glycerol-3-phosphate O-acyltransferase 3/4
MQFKKGCFEVVDEVNPIAIKYDFQFADAFWNSSKYSMFHYLFMVMTSWGIVGDVWYLPPMYKKTGESAVEFANRVKSAIAKQAGLKESDWDGQLKRNKPKTEWKENHQRMIAEKLNNLILI